MTDVPEDEMSIQDLTPPSENIKEPELPGEVQDSAPEAIVKEAEANVTVPSAPQVGLTQEQLGEIGVRTTDMIEAHEMIVRLITPIFDRSQVDSPARSIARNLAKIVINHSRDICVADIQRRISDITNRKGE